MLELKGDRGEENRNDKRKEGDKMRNKIKRMEKNKRERKSNVIIRKMEIKETKRKEVVERLLERMEAKIRMKDVRNIGGASEGG